jgi:hypothetical protein
MLSRSTLKLVGTYVRYSLSPYDTDILHEHMHMQ